MGDHIGGIVYDIAAALVGAAAAKVLLPDRMKPIEEVRKGDRVWSTNPAFAPDV